MGKAKLIVDYILAVVAASGKIVGRGADRKIIFHSIGVNLKTGATFEIYDHALSEVERLLSEAADSLSDDAPRTP